MDIQEILSAVRSEIQKCDQEELQGGMETALQYYDGDLPGPISHEVKFSTVVSRDIQNAVEATLAEIMPGFASDRPASFPAMSAEDEAQAETESAAVNWVIMSLCAGYVLFNRAIKDALLFGNGILKTSWDASIEPISQRIPNIPPEVLPAVLQGAEHYQLAEDDDGIITADVVQYRPRNRPLIEWVPVEELLVNPDHLEASLDTARFVCHRRAMRASDLIAAGAHRETVDTLTGTVGAGLNRLRPREGLAGLDTGHESTRLITVAESYYRLDEDDDGMAELRRIVTAGGPDGDQELLWDEPWVEQPFTNGIAFFSPRTWRGVTLTERLKSIQDTNSELIRQILDSGWRSLQQRLAVVEPLANMDDVLSSIKGGVVRVKDPGAVVPLPNIEPPQSSLALLEVVAKMRRESGGASIDSTNQAQLVAGDSAHAVERLMSALEQGTAMAARNFAETLIKPLYLKTHSLLKRHWPEAIPIRQRAGWTQAVPELWPPREIVSVSTGLTQGERDRQAGLLNAVLQQQMAFAQAGLKLAGPAELYNTALDFARMSGLTAPEQYFQNPDSPQAQQQIQAEADAAQQAEQRKHQQAIDLATLQGQAAYTVEELRAELDRYKIDVDHLATVINQHLKLFELNAKYDREPIPNAVNAP